MAPSSASRDVGDGESRTRALGYMLCAAASFVGSESLVKMLAVDLPSIELVIARSLPAALCAAAVSRWQGTSLLGRNRSVLAMRGLFGLVGLTMYFHALGRLPLGDANVIIRVAPAFTTLFAAAFLGEPLRRRWLVAFGCMAAGVVLVAKPTFGGADPAAAVCLGAAAAAGAAYTTLRALGRSERPWTVVFHFSAWCTVGGLPLLAWQGPVMPTSGQGLLLVGLGALGTAAQYFLTCAYRYAPAGQVALYSYVQIVFALGAGLVLFGESPDTGSLVGALLVVIGAFVAHG